MMKSDNFIFFTSRFNYSKEWFQMLYFFGGLFCVLGSLMCLISRTQFSETDFGKYILEILVATIFIGGLAVIIYSNWHFRKK